MGRAPPPSRAPRSSRTGADPRARLTAQVYLVPEDFERAARTSLELCRRAEAGEYKGLARRIHIIAS